MSAGVSGGLCGALGDRGSLAAPGERLYGHGLPEVLSSSSSSSSRWAVVQSVTAKQAAPGRRRQWQRFGATAM